ncbi:hypothetical protein MATL_G00226090 [Megalops atlanticus]|uniref:Interleukin-21 n=1 Tax=Megalops atlanticus TaxID=7932 RepID=A0A9D3PGZ8_MEGAT|nr:hypothetical protein MATL_G00226090 [Megalops atlanticus]
MKLFVCCLLVIAANAVTAAPAGQKLAKLREVLNDFKKINGSIEHNGLMLNTPLMDDDEKCCAGSVLKCFSSKLSELKTTKAEHMKKFRRNLEKSMIEKSVNACSEEDTKKAICQACEDYSMKDSRVFMQALESLLQKAYDRLKN